MPAEAQIHAGVCGFVTHVRATPDGEDRAALRIESDCEKIRALSERIGASVDPIGEITSGHDGAVLTAARATLKGCCSGCVVPSAIFKTIQVAGGLALPLDISVVLRNNAT